MNAPFPGDPSPIGVLVADSSRMQAQLLTTALRRRAEFRISTCQMDTSSLLRAVSSSAPSVALLSLNPALGIAENMAILRQFHISCPEIIKVLLVEGSDREVVTNAFRSGARGIFCVTEASLRLLRRCIEKVAAGQVWANTEQMNYLIDMISEVPAMRVINSEGDRLLTPREEQVVGLVSEGLPNREIARELNLSEHTIKKYMFRIFEKLGISTRVELVLYAINHGSALRGEWLAGVRLGAPQGPGHA